MTNIKVTPQMVADNMKDVICTTVTEFGKPTTYVTVRMKNGFTLRESTTCVDPANYDENIGKKLCLKRIEDKVWFLLGYMCQEENKGYLNTQEFPEELTDYVSVKFIKAKPMTRGAYNEFRGWTIPENENPEDEGYVIYYPDGYVSWCPKKQFEESNSVVKDIELAETARLMVSSDYKKRFIAEYRQTLIRSRKLADMCYKWDTEGIEGLGFTPVCPREYYTKQISDMNEYLWSLEKRAVLENIELTAV